MAWVLVSYHRGQRPRAGEQPNRPTPASSPARSSLRDRPVRACCGTVLLPIAIPRPDIL